MTIPLNTAQKQLVETSMDLVPQMIRSMTRTSAYVSEEEQQELCQIGYLAPVSYTHLTLPTNSRV